MGRHRSFAGLLALLLLAGGCATAGRRAAGAAPGGGPGGEAAARAPTGVVFEDRNGSGVREAGEPGLAGVLVSDGTEVVRTAADGSYALPAPPGALLFVIKPPGMSVPEGPHHLPRFYRRVGGGAREGGAPAAGLDFPLVRRPEPSRFDVLLVSDPQPRTPAELSHVRDDFVAQALALEAHGAAFGMTLGDIVFDDLSLFPRYSALFGTLGRPWYQVAGNHDMDYGAPDDAGALETFKGHFGPPDYAFFWGEALFVVLDNVVYRGADARRPDRYGGYDAGLSPAQVRFVEAVLAHAGDARLVVVSTHIPLFQRDEEGDLVPGTPGAEPLLDRLCARGNAVALAGHTHTLRHLYLTPEDGCPRGLHHQVLATVSGAWWSGPPDERGVPASLQADGAPNGYHLLEVDGARYRTRYVPLGLRADLQLRISLVQEPGGGAARVLVNLFDGGPRSTVRVAIDGGAPRPARPVVRTDPLAERLYGVRDPQRPWVKPERVHHLWEVELPPGLAPGAHAVVAEATDEFGRTHRGAQVLEVSPGPAAAAR
jgi:hypothetical protein